MTVGHERNRSGIFQAEKTSNKGPEATTQLYCFKKKKNKKSGVMKGGESGEE